MPEKPDETTPSGRDTTLRGWLEDPVLTRKLGSFFQRRGVSKDRAEDEAQEVISDALEGLGSAKAKTEAAFRGWVFGIARNVWRDWNRKTRKNPECGLEDEVGDSEASYETPSFNLRFDEALQAEVGDFDKVARVHKDLLQRIPSLDWSEGEREGFGIWSEHKSGAHLTWRQWKRLQRFGKKKNLRSTCEALRSGQFGPLEFALLVKLSPHLRGGDLEVLLSHAADIRAVSGERNMTKTVDALSRFAHGELHYYLDSPKVVERTAHLKRAYVGLNDICIIQ